MEDRRDFEKRMVKICPLLYNDMYGNPRHTIMTFGFDIGPGWYSIIEDLSLKIENIIKPIYRNEIENSDANCAQCGKKKQWHWFFCIIYVIKYFFMNRYKAFKAYPKWRKLDKNRKKFKYNSNSLWKTLRYTLFGYRWYIACKRWKPCYPKAVQVKEKFASLRFYMNHYVKEIEDLIDEAEEKCSKTCEECGRPGKLREGGWLKTLCDKCDKK